MKKIAKWLQEELDFLAVKCKAKVHWADYYVEFNNWRATTLYSKRMDTTLKVPRSMKSISNAVMRKLNYKANTFKRIITTSDRDLEKSLEPGFVEYDEKVEALRSAAGEQREKYKKLIREINFQDRIESVTKKYLFSLDPAKYNGIKASHPIIKKTIEDVLLLYSDSHIGEVISSEEMDGINEYNFDIFKIRTQYLVQQVIDICKGKMLGYQLDNLHIGLLGDIVCGIIHDELVETAEGTVIEWAYGGAIVLAQAIQELAQVFKKVYVHGVVGNHGRMHQKPNFKRKYVNWDYALYMNLTMLLARQKNVILNFPKSFFIHTQINNNEMLFLHGDNIRSWAGIPFYGINRMTANFGDLMASRGDYIKYFCLGHFHQTGQLDKTKGEKIINGSVCGGNEYVLGQMFTYSEPKQYLMGMHADKGMTWRFPINLSFADNTKPSKYTYDIDSNLVDEFGRLLSNRNNKAEAEER